VTPATTTERAGVRGLHPTQPQTLPFAPSLEVRAFVLERSRGNIVIYSTSGLATDEAVKEAGGADRHYLNHWHESMFPPEHPVAPLFVHVDDRDEVESIPVRAAFSRRHHLDEDFEVIPTPGHTPGATAYLWDSGAGRLLFTGDTIFLRGGEWAAAVLESSDREAYLRSLELIRELEFDALVPWATGSGEHPYAFTDTRDRRRRIDALIRRVKGGGST
jgi:glyoxylase-like metal-dependent hydrolase (beta-lactamase superfamily II)